MFRLYCYKKRKRFGTLEPHLLKKMYTKLNYSVTSNVSFEFKKLILCAFSFLPVKENFSTEFRDLISLQTKQLQIKFS